MGKRHKPMADSAFRRAAGIFSFCHRFISSVVACIRIGRDTSGTAVSAELSLPLRKSADFFFHLLRNIPSAACMVCCVLLYPSGLFCVHHSFDFSGSHHRTFFDAPAKFSALQISAYSDTSCGIILYLL